MGPGSSSPMFFRKSNLFVLWVLINFLLVSGLSVEAQTPTKEDRSVEKLASKALAETLKNNPWANIKGFRSAKFGMNAESVYRAIAKDFKVSKNKVTKAVNATTNETTLSISVPDLFTTGGTATVTYIMGIKSKKLTIVTVVWGTGAVEKEDVQDVVFTGNLLRRHFLKKRYQTNQLVSMGKSSDTQNILFRGLDRKNRMVMLHSTTKLKPEVAVSTKANSYQVFLQLFYIDDLKNIR
jgi:hypothetical protein